MIETLNARKSPVENFFFEKQYDEHIKDDEDDAVMTKKDILKEDKRVIEHKQYWDEKKGAEEQPNTAWKTPSSLMMAAMNGHADLCKLLISKGASIQDVCMVRVFCCVTHLSITVIDFQGGRTALMMAVWNGRKECCEILLDAGSDINAPDNVSCN
jgi:hypothetical protein